jgi:O-antigen/teichoic acid export membrane protein
VHVTEGKGSARRRLGLVTIDQAISGGSNVLVALLAARLLSSAEFGLFGIVLLGYMLLVGLTRGLVSDPLLLHPEEVPKRAGEAIGATCILAVAQALVLFAIGLLVQLWSPPLGDALMVLSACMPLLQLQDLGRYLAIAIHRPVRAVVLDSVWLALMLVAIAVLFTVSDDRSLPLLVGAWAGSGAIAGLLLFANYRWREVRLGLSWPRYTWRFSWRFLIIYTAQQGSALGVSIEVGAIAGARALGGVQGALLLVRPFTMFWLAASTAGIAEIARSADDPPEVWRHVRRTSWVGGAVAAVNMAVLLLLPNGLGETLLGDSWGVAQPLFLPTGLFIVLSGLLGGPIAGLIGLRAMGKATTINIVMAILGLIVAALGAVINGALGAMWLAVAGQAVMMSVSWVVFTLHMRGTEPAASPEPAQAVPAGAETGAAAEG